MECRWIRTTEHDLPKLRRASRGVALLPVSSIESHGPHAPLGSDTLNLEYVLDRIAEREPIAILPQLPYSSVVEAMQCLGAIHIDTLLLIEFVETICDEVYRNGFDKVVILHGHGGNPALHQMLCKRALERAKPYAIYSIPPLPDMHEFIKSLMQQSEFGHGCEMEVSMNLVSTPELVHLEYLKGKVFRRHAYPDIGSVLTQVDWIGRWPEMAVGDPSKATQEKGEKILEEWTRRVVELLRRIKRDRLVLRATERFRKARLSHRKDLPGGRPSSR